MARINYKVGSEIKVLEGKQLTSGYPTTVNGVKVVKFAEKHKGQYIQVAYESRPELAALVAEYEKELADERAARAKAQAEADAPYIAEMNRKAEELREAIPADHVEVEVKAVGDADGYPILEYSCDGVILSWDQVNLIGTANAIREGALGAFESIHVASISKDMLAVIKGEKAEDKAEAEKEAEARAIELATAEVPEAALKAYRRYNGDAERAWEDGDGSAWALIRKWTPYIERQRLCEFERL